MTGRITKRKEKGNRQRSTSMGRKRPVNNIAEKVNKLGAGNLQAAQNEDDGAKTSRRITSKPILNFIC